MAAPSEAVAPLVEEAGAEEAAVAAPAEVGAEAEEVVGAEVRAAQEAQQVALPAALWLS